MSLEQEAKRLLMERLDDCLKVHADLLTHRTLAVFMSCRISPSFITI